MTEFIAGVLLGALLVFCRTEYDRVKSRLMGEYFSVEKGERNGRTYTQVTCLEREGRMRELARITGGERITDALLSGAAELLDQAEEFKQSFRI